MRNPGGYALITSPVPTQVHFDGLRCEAIGAGTTEIDCFSCRHCNRVIHVQTRSQGDEYFCRGCMGRICPPCADHPCIPFMRKVEAQEERDRRLRAYGD